MNLIKQFVRAKKAVIATTTVLISSAVISTPVLADQFKAFPGSMCLSSDPASDSRLVRGENYVYNSSSSNAYVVCPIVRGFPGDDQVSNSGPYTTIFALKNNNQTITCRLSGYDSNGDNASTQSASISGFGKLSFSTARVAKRNIYGIFCTLPPSNGIVSYYSFF